ncbi:MAG: hypothetical protein JEZ14_11645 [Marinilabiliaceae bacterium]|nr:hypothetical protein [Marinilabiliaceae bacterium]
MHYCDIVSNSPKSNGTGESGDINVDYTNTLSFVMADATNLAVVANNERYNLSANTGVTALATVSGIASADYGRTITLYSGPSHCETV